MQCPDLSSTQHDIVDNGEPTEPEMSTTWALYRAGIDGDVN